MVAAPGWGEAENDSAAGRHDREPPVRNPAGSCTHMSPCWEGAASPRLLGLREVTRWLLSLPLSNQLGHRARISHPGSGTSQGGGGGGHTFC